jgi:16S rRNA (adenine(1408)-N(1))-methyltransferase
MAKASRRAARNPKKGGLPNALFVAAGVEVLPHELAGLADLVTVRFPWGSLLRGALGLDEGAAIAIARLVSPLGALEMTVSITDRDAVGDGRPAGPFGQPDVERIRETYADLGFRLCDVRSLDRADLRAIDSSWAQRLRVDRDRVAWVLRLEPSGRRLVSADPAQTVNTTASQA